VVKLISVLLFLYGCAFGLDNQYQLALNGVTSATASTFLKNVGQVEHAIFVSVTGCSISGSTTFPLAMQGSYDNVTWFYIGPGTLTVSTASPYTGLNYGTGGYPYLRVNYYQTVAGCTVTAWYTGNVTSFTPMRASTLYQTYSAPVASGTAVVGVVASQTPMKFVVYGLVVYARSGTLTISVYSAANPGCTGGGAVSSYFLTSIPTATTAVTTLPPTGVPYYTTATNENLCLAVSTGSGDWSYAVIGRFE